MEDNVDRDLVHERVESALQVTDPGFGNFFLQRFLGLEISYGDESCTVHVPTSTYMHNPQGWLHAGVIATAADISMGHLCHRELSTAVTLDMDLKFMRPISGPARCVARFLKKGRTVVQLESRVLDEDDRLCAHATATWFRLPDEKDNA
jgi:acyl-CoA thioesterase